MVLKGVALIYRKLRGASLYLALHHPRSPFYDYEISGFMNYT